MTNIKPIYALDFQPITGDSPFQVTATDVGGTLENFFSVLLGTFTVIGGLAFIIYFLLGALNYLTAQGDQEKVKKAQRYLSNAAIGLVIIVMTWAITGILGLLLGFDILDLAARIGELTP